MVFRRSKNTETTLDWEREGDRLDVRPAGVWTVSSIETVEKAARRLMAESAERMAVDLSGVRRMDTSGAWLVYKMMTTLQEAGAQTEIVGGKDGHLRLMHRIEESHPKTILPERPPNIILDMLNRLGDAVLFKLQFNMRVCGFFGSFLLACFRTLLNPSRLRLTPMVNHMEQVGLNAVPIVALISFLIGMVLAFMGAQQLERFGAQVFMINLVEVTVFRELGIMLTAIVVAGRSGSSFTAQIGTMMVNEEVAAMRSMGIDPMEALVMPRILALLIMLPLLGFIGSICGLFGAGVMAWVALDIEPGAFVQRFYNVVRFWNVFIGLFKAPFFALTIGLVGCYEGFQVRGSSESVGRLTTQSVVESIFNVIILDALFALFFSAIGK
jgi:phospholipid/cholesterol/gamma-HCH transport system permease protein